MSIHQIPAILLLIAFLTPTPQTAPTLSDADEVRIFKEMSS
ncbi:MAG TPA: hypothetical protein VK466_03095 [Terriglobales bacterium]|nr:hypothetical protein [Terriglobales bacterium]